MTNTVPALLSLSLAKVKDNLRKFATQSDYLEQLQIAFGDKFDTNIALGIASSIKADDWSFLPSIEIRTDSELAGNNGAFDTVNNRILANDKFLLLNSSQPERIVNLLLEEIGHKFDVILNGQVDSAGDEGAIFAAISQGKALSAPELAQLKATDDHTTLSIDGKQVAVELETWTASDPNGESHTGTEFNDILTGGVGNDNIDGGAGNDLINGGEGNNVLKGGTGKDTLIGGSGNDYFNFRNDSSDVSTDGDVFIGGGGNDTVFLRSGADGSKIVYTDINAGGTISGGGSIQGIPNIIFNGGSGDDFVNVSGSSNANLTGGDGNDYLIGGAGNDKLYGGAGNDRLEGGGGTNTLVGGTGDDNYGVTSATDIVVENPDEGTDTVWTNQSYTLVDNVENMVVVGNNLTNSGNSANNYIAIYGAGNTISALDGNDTLIGGVGIDTLIGGIGDDIYTVQNSGAVIKENAGEGTDTVWTNVSYTLSDNVENMALVGSITGTGNDVNNTMIAYGPGDKTMNGGGGEDLLIGGDGNDTLNGGDGNDILDGGAAVNTLIGGAGDDNYGVHNSADVIVESPDGGNDTVWSNAASYTLSTNVENLALVGSVNGTGNDGDNQIIAYGAGDNIISGGKGNDYLAGGAGDDTYTINADTDSGIKTIVETADAGKDTISFAGSSTAVNIDLSLTAAQAVTAKIQLVLPLVNLENVIGGAGDDTIAGNSLNNTLTGGAGADKFVFSGGVVSASTAVSLLFGSDTITDFTVNTDKLVLSQATFSAIASAGGAISNFANVADDSLVKGSAAAIVYSQATGKLFYNQNGATAEFGDGGGQFATLSGLPTLTASDFQIV
jgi:trimeric autotransporter adhesin